MEIFDNVIYQISGKDLKDVIHETATTAFNEAMIKAHGIFKEKEEQLYTVEQVAARLGVSIHTVRNYYRSGQLDFIRVGGKYVKFREKHIRDFITRKW